MTHLPTLTIGIPAHNEAKSIKHILESVLVQTEHGFTLKQVRVYCDGCTDNTAKVARSVSDPRIIVIDDGKRVGKTARLNEMFSDLTSDVLLMLDGDIDITSANLLTDIMRPFADARVGLVGGNSRPKAPKTFVQRAVYSTFEVFDASRSKHNHGDNIFSATGSCLAIAKKLAKQITLPKIVNEDVYLYLITKKLGQKFVFVPSAIVWYKLPLNLGDYIKQVLRSEPRSAHIELESYFPDLIDDATKRDVSWYAVEVFRSFLRNPFGVVMMIGINLVCLPFLHFVMTHYRLNWFTAKSTH